MTTLPKVTPIKTVTFPSRSQHAKAKKAATVAHAVLDRFTDCVRGVECRYAMSLGGLKFDGFEYCVQCVIPEVKEFDGHVVVTGAFGRRFFEKATVTDIVQDIVRCSRESVDRLQSC